MKKFIFSIVFILAALFGISNLLNLNNAFAEIVNAPVIDSPQTGSGKPDNDMGAIADEQGKWLASHWYYFVIAFLVLVIIVILISRSKKDNK